MQNNICAFFGHRNVECGEELYNKIENEVEALITKGSVTNFLFGGYGEFDSKSHFVVTKLKEKYPFLKRIYCYSDEKTFRQLKRRGQVLENEYEETLFLPLEYNYWYTRVYYRNCKMIDISNVILFYVNKREGSGAYKALAYAKKKGKIYKNLALE